jgi:hypothetical protein
MATKCHKPTNELFKTVIETKALNEEQNNALSTIFES